jgi:hypothetical protein
MSNPSTQDPEDNLPEWLRALRRRQDEEHVDNGEGDGEATSESSQPAADPEASKEPDWLREIRERYQRGKKPREDAAEERALEETKPRKVVRMQDSTLPADEEPATFVKESVSAGPEPQEETPNDWFDAAAEPPREEQANSSLSGLDEANETPGFTPAFTEDEPGINPGELPGWLQALRPSEVFPKDSRSKEILPGSAEGAGPLAGLSDVLPADPSLSQVGRAPVFSSKLEITENQGLHAAAFTKLLEEVDKSPEEEALRVARPTRVLNLAMAGLLLLAVIFPLLTGSQSAIRPDPQLFLEAASVFNVIEVLPAGAPVLVAFEVQPALYGEMTPLLSAVFAHLLEKQAQLVLISTRPTGPALAERLLQEQLSALPAVARGAYDQLGYLSGGMAALRSFINDPRRATLSGGGSAQWQSPSLEPIQQFSNFALVLVVSSSAEDGRAWIEQSAGSMPVRLAAVTSAQATPLLRVYLQSEPPILQGLVGGLQGAALYERLRAQDGLGRIYWDAYSFGLGAIVLIILLGGLYGRFLNLKPEKPIASEAARGG